MPRRAPKTASYPSPHPKGTLCPPSRPTAPTPPPVPIGSSWSGMTEIRTSGYLGNGNRRTLPKPNCA